MSNTAQNTATSNDSVRAPSHSLDACVPTNSQPDAAWEMPGDRYRILGEIARGGMGVVLRASDVSFDRPLAIKVLLHGRGDAAANERRFLEEAAITGQLQHPGIPPVHDFGRLSDGRPFFSMKLIQGRTLTELLKERPTPQTDLPRFLKIFEQIAQTVAYTHSQGIIHRDLKPLNVMVGAFGEVQVMDWGLAKRLRDGKPAEAPRAAAVHIVPAETATAVPGALSESSQTQAGQVLGTFAYMAPEQARGEVQSVDERCDVFGLGAILCTILTGDPPYQGSEGRSLWQKAQQAELDDAWSRLERCGADTDLILLAISCLAPRKEDRPRDGRAVADAVAGYLTHVQERLQQAHVAQARAEVKAREANKRRRLAVGLAAAVVTLIAGIGAAGLWYTHDQGRQTAEFNSRRDYLQREVTDALDEVDRQRADLHRRLQDDRHAAKLLSELHEWRALVDAAQAAWTRADRLAEGGRDMLPEDLRERLTSSARALDADADDHRLAVALDKIRLESADTVAGGLEIWRAGPKLAKVFADAGFDLPNAAPEVSAARIRQSKIRPALVAALDFWALVTQDDALRRRLLEVSCAADPEPWRDRLRQPEIWRDGAKLNALADDVDYTAQSPHLLAALAQRLRVARGDAVEFLRRALLEHPGDFWLFFELGMASANPIEQAGAFRAALGIRPDSSVTYYSLGVVQFGERKFAEAKACYKKAIELDGQNAGALNNMGLVLAEFNRRGEAVEYYKKAIAADPQSAAARINLGADHQAQRKFAEAAQLYHAVLESHPKSPAAYNNLSTLLREQKKLDEAVAWCRKSLDVQRDNPTAWCNLGHTLREQGKLREALDAMHQGHKLGMQEKSWRHPSAQWVKDIESSIALDEKLSVVLRGEEQPRDAREQVAFAELCVTPRQRYAAATQFYADAFAAEARLASGLLAGHRYRAAGAAARAGRGLGMDAASLTDAQRKALRQQALEWLQAELQGWSKALDSRFPPAAVVHRKTEPWLTDPDLACVRDESALANLPTDERAAWRQVWSDLAALQQRSLRAAGK